jgi:ATP-dependent Clp protease ATP-binding subunit ClpX
MESILLETMYNLPGMEDVSEVVINGETVEGKAQPLYIYGEKKKENVAVPAVH